MNAKKAALQRVLEARSAMTRIMNAVPAAMRVKFTADAVKVAAALTDSEVAHTDDPTDDDDLAASKGGANDDEGKHARGKHVKKS